MTADERAEAAEVEAVEPSPPFRDSDAMYIIAKRMEASADKMTRHDYSTVEADLADIAEWLDWLAKGIAARAAAEQAQP